MRVCARGTKAKLIATKNLVASVEVGFVSGTTLLHILLPRKSSLADQVLLFLIKTIPFGLVEDGLTL